MISAIPDLDSSPSTIVLVIGFAVAALSVLLKIVALGVIPGNRRPSSGMAWVLPVGRRDERPMRLRYVDIVMRLPRVCSESYRKAIRC